MGNQDSTQELVIVKTDDHRQLFPVFLCLYNVAVNIGNGIQRSDSILEILDGELDAPFGSIYGSIVGKECQLAVAELGAACKDITAVSRRDPILFAFIRVTVHLYLLIAVALLARIAGCTIIQGKADGVKNSRLTATCTSDNTEYGAVLKSTFFKVDHLSIRTVKRCEVEYFKFQ